MGLQRLLWHLEHALDHWAEKLKLRGQNIVVLGFNGKQKYKKTVRYVTLLVSTQKDRFSVKNRNRKEDR